MTNDEIILKNRVFLMEEGVLNGTGNVFMYADKEGTREIEMPEEIHTFKEWKRLGYSVKKGEHSIARFPIWQKSKKKRKEADEEDEQERRDGYYYMKVAFFFTKDQVEPINP